jgi:hypothetical protein
MSFKQALGYSKEKIELPTYSLKELEDFGTRLQAYAEEKELPILWNRGGGLVSELLKEACEAMKITQREKVSIINLNEAAVAFGAMKKRIHIGIPTYSVVVNVLERDSYGGVKRIEVPGSYDLFMHKYECLQNLRSRREYVEGKRDEAYDKMSKEVAATLKTEHDSTLDAENIEF